MKKNPNMDEREAILHEMMRKKRLTKTRVAKMMGVSRTTVNNIICSNDVMFPHVYKFATALNVTTDFVYNPKNHNKKVISLISKLDYAQSEELLDVLHSMVDIAIKGTN